ncbi:MAG: hypothetical protein IPK72_04310 [Candidatus Eisenbacteria bacterium]|nr:hypothetical protein [Candidatus Eisenbacteria bacterium]
MSTPFAGLRSGRLGPELWNNLRVGVLTGSIGGWVLGILMAAATLALNPVLLRSASDVTLLLLGFVLVNAVFCLALGVLGALGKTAIFAWTGRELSDTKMAAFVTGLVFFLITGLYGWTWCRWHGIGGLTPSSWPGPKQLPVLLLIAGVAVLLARLMTYALYLLIVHFKKPERRRPGEVRKAFLILVYMGSAFAFFLAVLRLTAAPVRRDAGLSQGARDPSGGSVALLAIDGMSDLDFERLRNAAPARGETRHWSASFADATRLPLESAADLVPPVAWTQVATGRAVEAHGIFDYQTQVVRGLGTPLAVGPSQIGVFDLFRTVLPMFRMTRPVPMRSYMRGAKGLWNMTTDAGLRATVVNWWVSWPAERIIGTVVTDHAFLRLSQPANWQSLPPDRETFPNSRLLELAPLAQAETDSLLDLDALARALALFERERVPRDVLLSDLLRSARPRHSVARSIPICGSAISRGPTSCGDSCDGTSTTQSGVPGRWPS